MAACSLPIAAAPARRRRRVGSKRNDEEAELDAGQDEEAAAAEEGDDKEAVAEESEEAAEPAAAAALPDRRSSRRAAAAGVLAAVAAVQALDVEGEAPKRSLPQRAAAANSPSGKRRRLTSMPGLAELAAAAAAAEAEVEASPALAAAWAALEAAEAAVAAEQGVQEPVGEHGCYRAAHSPTSRAPTNPNAPPLAPAFPPGDKPAHLAAVHAKVAEEQEKNRLRIERVTRKNGECKEFDMGDAVLYKPPTFGKNGRPVGPRRIVCRVVHKQPYNGVMRYKLRCNAGLIECTAAAVNVAAAPLEAAQKLRFEGTEREGVPTCSINKAMEAERGGNSVGCTCSGTCGKSCACKKSGILCSRHDCKCLCSKGPNCGNYNL